jgi:hypothetical protein
LMGRARAPPPAVRRGQKGRALHFLALPQRVIDDEPRDLASDARAHFV